MKLKQFATFVVAPVAVAAAGYFGLTTLQGEKETVKGGIQEPTQLLMARMDDTVDIGPVQPGELSPPKGAQGEGVQVLMVGPQGEHKQPTQAIVVFDRPMVALSALNDLLALAPMDCGPDIPGKARWAGTTTAVWLPDEGEFPLSHEVTCTIPEGLTAPDGASLSQPLEFSFRTEPLKVVSIWPRAQSNTLDPSTSIYLEFNQPVKPSQIAANTKLTDPNGEFVPLFGTQATGKEDHIPDWMMADDETTTVLLKGAMKKDTAYALNVSKIRGLAGPLGLKEPYEVALNTIPAPAIQDHEPVGTQVEPYATLHLQFTTETSYEDIAKHIRISPEPPDGFNPPTEGNGRYWYHSLRLAPMTTYTVTMDPGLKDTFDQTYPDDPRTRSWSFTTGHLAPLLDVATGPLVFPANNPDTLPIRSRNLTDLYAAVESVSVRWVAQNIHKYQWVMGQGRRMTRSSRVDLTDELAVSDRVRLHEIDLTPAFEDGYGYFGSPDQNDEDSESADEVGMVLVETWSSDLKDYRGNTLIHRTLLQKTDLGTTLKIGPDGLSTWVTRLSDGSPVADATVEVYRSGRMQWSGTTSSDGTAFAKGVVPHGWDAYDDPFSVVATLGEDTALTTSKSPHQLDTWNHGVYARTPNTSHELRLHTFTDRGVYRRGETAHVALTARLAGKQGLELPKSAQVKWNCSDTTGNTIHTGNGRTDAHGALSFDLDIPEGAALGNGNCNISVTAGRYSASDWLSIPIKAYRAPTFRVDVSTPAQAIVGESLVGNGNGRYLFGAPMVGMEASWTAYETDTTPSPSGWDEYVFGQRSSDRWWEDEYHPQKRLSSGEGTLNSKGQIPWSIDLPITEEPKTRTVTMEVEVTDVSRQVIANRSQVLVHPADIYAGLKFGSGVGTAGTETKIDFVTVTPEGEARAGVPVDFSIARRSWDSIRQKDMDGRWTWVNSIKDEEIKTSTSTSGSEPSTFGWTPPEGGYYVVKASVRDAKGRLSRSERGLYVAGSGATWARDDNNKLTLIPDKRRYAPGETATILIQSPRPGLSALVTVEREGVVSQQVVKLKTTADTVKIPLGESAVPNVFVSCVAVEGAPPANSPEGTIPSWYLGYSQLEVSPSDRALDVDISTDATEYQPGQDVTATVVVKRNGKPVRNAHVVLYAVDYGVLSLTGYKTPNAFDTYYAKHNLLVRTADNRTQVLNRAQFLAKGAPTGGGGDDGMGATRSRFVTTPLWIPDLETARDGTVTTTFQLPDNLTTFQLMAVVDEGAQAYGSDSHQLQVAKPLMAQPALPRLLRTGDMALAGIVVHNNRSAMRMVQVEASATGVTLAEGSRTVTVPANGALEVAFALDDPQPGEAAFRFDVSSGEDRDIVEVKIPVVRPQPVEVVATMGTTKDLAQEEIALMDGLLDGVGGLNVQVSPTVMVGADSALTYMLDYPYNCLEQTSSRLMAALLAQELGERAALDVSDEKLQGIVSTNLALLDEFRHPSGGLMMWPSAYASPHAMGTAYAMEARFKAGKMPSRDTINFLRGFLSGKWIPRWWNEASTREAQVRVALALARVDRGEAAYNSMLYDSHRDLSPTGQAELLEAIARTSGPWNQLAQRLLSTVEGQLHVDATAAIVKDGDQFFWNGSMAPTAAALSALMVVDPNHPLVERIAKGLMHGKRSGRWNNTYTTAKALQALRDYTSVRESDSQSTVAEVQLNGKTIINELLTTSPADTFVPMSSAINGPLQVKSDGGIVYYETRLSYATKLMPPRDEGFTVVRSYRMLEGSGSNSGVTPGALVRVDLRVVTPIQRTDVVVHDPLPAGLEPVDTSFETSAAVVTEEGLARHGRSNRNAGWSDWVFNHRELDDASMTLFADVMPAGIHTYSYLARATTPGVYSMPAAHAKEMYRPEVFGRTKQGMFIVGEAAIAMNEQ